MVFRVFLCSSLAFVLFHRLKSLDIALFCFFGDAGVVNSSLKATNDVALIFVC
jgi:hypothetical protein